MVHIHVLSVYGHLETFMKTNTFVMFYYFFIVGDCMAFFPRLYGPIGFNRLKFCDWQEIHNFPHRKKQIIDLSIHPLINQSINQSIHPSIHPSIFYTCLIQFKVAGGPETFPSCHWDSPLHGPKQRLPKPLKS